MMDWLCTRMLLENTPTQIQNKAKGTQANHAERVDCPRWQLPVSFSQRGTKHRHIGRCEEESRSSLVIKRKYLYFVLFVYTDDNNKDSNTIQRVWIEPTTSIIIRRFFIVQLHNPGGYYCRPFFIVQIYNPGVYYCPSFFIV